LRHKNSSKWAKRIVKRGLNILDDATRAAFAEQLQKHGELKRKMNSMKGNASSSEEESSDDEDEEKDEIKRALKSLNKAKDKTAKVLDDRDEAPKKGLFALPFMVCFTFNLVNFAIMPSLKSRYVIIWPEFSRVLH
jgi:U3 small nucleolar RNA-associated protein 14